mmetsp:Transcript_1859/g.4069  ORF Transcript_1859/g.4069 Transcript_1859/m.4069 type:complete len:117 (-) Transcript_1859:2465-2815(-)
MEAEVSQPHQEIAFDSERFAILHRTVAKVDAALTKLVSAKLTMGCVLIVEEMIHSVALIDVDLMGDASAAWKACHVLLIVTAAMNSNVVMMAHVLLCFPRYPSLLNYPLQNLPTYP